MTAATKNHRLKKANGSRPPWEQAPEKRRLNAAVESAWRTLLVATGPHRLAGSHLADGLEICVSPDGWKLQETELRQSTGYRRAVIRDRRSLEREGRAHLLADVVLPPAIAERFIEEAVARIASEGIGMSLPWGVGRAYAREVFLRGQQMIADLRRAQEEGKECYPVPLAC